MGYTLHLDVFTRMPHGDEASEQLFWHIITGVFGFDKDLAKVGVGAISSGVVIMLLVLPSVWHYWVGKFKQHQQQRKRVRNNRRNSRRTSTPKREVHSIETHGT